MTEYSRTDVSPTMPTWLALVLASAGTLLAIGVLWAATPSRCGSGDLDLSGPAPCVADATGPALVSAGILLALLATVFVVAFTAGRRRGTVTLILAGAMLLVFLVGLMVTVTAAGTGPMVVS